MTNKWVLRYLNYSDLPSSGLVKFYKSEKTAPEEFSLFCKIFTPGVYGFINPITKQTRNLVNFRLITPMF
jgi:hypothetical protein